MKKKGRGKRLLALALAVVLTAAGISYPGGDIYAMGKTGSADEHQKAAGLVDVKKSLVNNSGSDAAIRAVLDKIDELPQYGNANFRNLERGSAARPFVILEIVPYEEAAEFGYMVKGCEPVKIEEMVANGDGALMTIGSADASRSTQYNVQFFMDEKILEGDVSRWSENNTWQIEDYNGYYEYVGAGNGKLTRKTEGTATTMVRQEGGDFIWHTVHDFENQGDYAGELTFTDVIDGAKDYALGERIYTVRRSGPDNPTATVAYLYYQNYEVFLLDTLELTREQAANFSVVVKTITPDELNSTSEWVDYADLIYVSPLNHMGGDAMRNIWKKYNRLGHTSPYTYSDYRPNQFEYNDISFDVAVKIAKRASEDVNFAAVVLDNRLCDLSNNALTSKTKKNVTYDLYDFNMRKTGLTYYTEACSNNVYKLAIMLMTMNPYLFRSIYLDGGYITSEAGGKVINNTLQTGDAAVYWAGYAFALLPVDRGAGYFNAYTYFVSPEAWQNYSFAPNISEQRFKTFVSKHVYTFDGNSFSYQTFLSGRISADDEDSIYDEFKDYCAGKGITDANPSDAVRFILDIHTGNGGFGEGTTLKVLDIEPSVALNAQSRPEWVLSESYIRFMVPDFRGTIEITHQTTAEFVGKIEDLNSTYDLIYIGLDHDAFNSARKYIQVAGTWGWFDITDFNDASMDGKIYFHVGDTMTGTAYSQYKSGKLTRTRSAKFLYSVATGRTVDSEELRFSGNDISRIKSAELAEYIQAGRPIVAAGDLYNLEPLFIDATTNLYGFVSTYRDEASKGVYATSDISRINELVRNSRPQVTFTSLPAKYDGTTKNDTSEIIENPNYLPTYTTGNAYLEYKFNVNADNYRYRIYVDQDRDGKFTDEEIVKDGATVMGANTCTYELSLSIVGLVQWKIEVYSLANPTVHSTQAGCSAVRTSGSAEKKVIKVLQILPKSGDFSGRLNLEENSMFKKYYSNLNDFNITVNTITWNDFEKFFAGSGFAYNMAENIGPGNPDAQALAKATDNVDARGSVIKSELDNKEIGSLSDYNMIIVGFGDGYGNTNLVNDNGAVEYLQYYTDMGKSILYTHDITSLYNLPVDGGVKVFGYTANAMMRDLMGMNRYMGVSNQLSATAARNMRQELIDYQNKNAAIYDQIGVEQKQGYTYYAMKRLGWTEDQANRSANANYGNKVPYKYMITNPASNGTTAVCTGNMEASASGFNNANDLTTMASKINEGQITVYPYKISDNLPIAPTHAQWYQLNIEDPEVTVWYCLADPAAEGENGTGSARTHSNAKSGDGSALTYGVSPNDASNNYYIYSKGNIFYSGVGHSTVNGDMEAKLFVNTMIAAYRLTYGAPYVEISKAELAVAPSSGRDSVLDVPVTKLSDTDYSADIPDEYTDYVRIYFKPEDMSFSNNLNIRISTSGTSNYITEVYSAEADAEEAADAVHTSGTDNFFPELKNNKEYYFYYPLSELTSGRNTILFEVMSDRSSEIGLSYLSLKLQSLYMLD